MQNESRFDQKSNIGDERTPNPTPPQPYSKNQKIAAAVLAIFAVFIIILWLVQLKMTISQPFVYQGGSQDQSANTSTQNSDEALKSKDTDGDGLSDYDELYVYHTSPYLADSDSDGISDGEEVRRGTDPNCPEGRNCTSSGIVNGDQSVVQPGQATQDNSALNNLLNQFGVTPQPATSTAPANPSNTGNTSASSIMPSNMDAATLRQLLINAGMDKNVLDQISDQDLMNSYQQMLNQPAQ